MRVGANARQHAKIRKLLAEGVTQHVISKMLQIEPQSLEKIVAHIEDREPRTLATDNDPKVKAMVLENAALREKLANFEADDDDEEDEDS